MAGERDVAQEVAEAGAKDVEVAVVVHRLDAGGVRFGFGPDDGRPVAGKREDRQGTRRHEELVRDAVVRQLVRDGADERRLAIAPALPADAGTGGGGARLAVAAHDHSRAEGAAVRKLGRNRPFFGVVVGHRALDLRDERRGREGVEKGAAEEAILHHVAHRAFLDLGMVEFEHEGRWAFARAPVRHLDLEDRLGVSGDPAPDAQHLEEPLRGEGERIAAAVELPFARARRGGVHDGDRQPARGEREGERGAVRGPRPR